MPVLVTAADRPLARAVASRLLAIGGEVRAYAADPVPALRALGAFVATGDLDDEGLLEAAMTDVHTVVHLGDGLLTADPERAVAEARTVASAAANAEVSRIIALSLSGVGQPPLDPLRAAYDEIERLLAACPVPTIVVRTSLVASEDVIDALVTVGLSDEALETPVAAVSAADVVALVVALDDARSRATSGHLTLTAYGRPVLTIGQLLEHAGGLAVIEGVARFDLLGRRVVSAAVAETLTAAIIGPWTPDVVDEAAVDGFALMGIKPRAVSG